MVKLPVGDLIPKLFDPKGLVIWFAFIFESDDAIINNVCPNGHVILLSYKTGKKKTRLNR